MFFAFHLFFGLGTTWAKVFIFLPSPCFSSLYLWAFQLLLLPYHFIMPTIVLSSFCFVLNRGLVICCISPLLRQFSALGFPGPLLIHLPLLGFVGQHSCCTSPFHHFIPRASLAHLLPLYLFYSHDFSLNPLGFLSPITTSLLLIISWAYWLLGQPTEFTNSFPKLPRPIYYFISWASSVHLLSLYLLLFLQAHWPSILPFRPIGLALLFHFLTFFKLLGFFNYWALCQKSASTIGQQQRQPK